MSNRPGMRGDAGSAGSAGREPGAVDEIALMDGVAAERMEAFESLYRLYHPRLTRFLQGMTRRPAMVDEVLDDTMLVVWRKAHTYDANAKVSTWIFGIAYRQALKALGRLQDDAEPFAPGQEESVESSLPGPEVAAQQLELHRHLRQAMVGLSAEHRAVIELTYFLGYSCRDIAVIMDCPVDTVKTRMFYARRRLRSLLDLGREEAI